MRHQQAKTEACDGQDRARQGRSRGGAAEAVQQLEAAMPGIPARFWPGLETDYRPTGR